MRAQTRAVQNDVIRGVRWGVILVLTVLLTIAGYRVFVSNPASAAPMSPAPVVRTPAADPLMQVNPEATAVERPQAAQPAPKSAPARRAPQPDVPEPPARGRTSNQFSPAPAAPKAAPRATVVDGTLPEAAVTEGAELPSVAGLDGAFAAPPEAKSGRTTKIVRSVGRILRIGKKETPEP